MGFYIIEFNWNSTSLTAKINQKLLLSSWSIKNYWEGKVVTSRVTNLLSWENWGQGGVRELRHREREKEKESIG